MATPGPQTVDGSRPLKWLLVVGGGLVLCAVLTICVVILLPVIVSAGIAGPPLLTAMPMVATGVGMGGLADQDVYQEAVRLASEDENVQAALGTPVVDVPESASGEVSTRGASGTADIIVTLKGPKGEGTLQASARRENGTWVYYTLLVQVKGENIVIEQ